MWSEAKGDRRDAKRVLEDPAERKQAPRFLGTIRQHAELHDAWMLVMHAVGRATGCSDEAVRAFLDSRYGRHFADEVASAICSGRDLAAGVDVVERWMELRIDALIEREIGIPQGLPT